MATYTHPSSSDPSKARDQRLFSVTKLSIPEGQIETFVAINEAVRAYMYQPQYDPSHDYEHIQRVVNIAHNLLTTSLSSPDPATRTWAQSLDLMVVYVAAMVHDVGETKYQDAGGKTQYEVIDAMLKQQGMNDQGMRHRIGTIAENVSFTKEKNDPKKVLELVKELPELAIVQDADRIDAVGAIGAGRCFVFGGVNDNRKKQTIGVAVQLIAERFELYEGFWKTAAGRTEGSRRLEKMKQIREWWKAEANVEGVL